MTEHVVWWKNGHVTVCCLICGHGIGLFPVTTAAPPVCLPCASKPPTQHPHWTRTAGRDAGRDAA